jgi:hypothetical protein
VITGVWKVERYGGKRLKAKIKVKGIRKIEREEIIESTQL